MRLHQVLVLIITAFLLLGGCTGGDASKIDTETVQEEPSNTEPTQEEPSNTETTTKEQTDPEKSTDLNKASEIAEQDEEKTKSPEHVADMILLALKEKNMETVATYVHPEKGVRFSPYAYVNVEADQVFSAEKMKELMSGKTVFSWGPFDGSGLPIEMTFEEYYHRFIYDVDFVNADKKSVNERLGEGTTLDNAKEIYSEATIVEYHFTGFDPEFEGMDWRSLRLVLKKENDSWYLVGIIHDEWTI